MFVVEQILTERDGTKIARQLRDSILRLELRPGVGLDEADLSEALGVSRTPIREAIIQLIADGLVVREGRKARVAPLDFDEVPELYDALLISSRMIHRLAAVNRTQEDLLAVENNLQLFESLIETSSGVERSEANLAFHQSISAAAHNRYFGSFYEQALIGTIRLARACFANSMNSGDETDAEILRSHLKETARQHRLIYNAIEAKDVETADELATLHYVLTKTRVEKVLFSGSSAFRATPTLDLSGGSWDFS